MKEQTAKFFFGPDNHLPPLGIVSLEGATELSDKIEAHLARWAQQAGRKAETFRIPCSCPRFSSGDGKDNISSILLWPILFLIT